MLLRRALAMEQLPGTVRRRSPYVRATRQASSRVFSSMLAAQILQATRTRKRPLHPGPASWLPPTAGVLGRSPRSARNRASVVALSHGEETFSLGNVLGGAGAEAARLRLGHVRPPAPT